MRTSVSLGVAITGLVLSVNGLGGTGNILGGGTGSSGSNGVAAGGYYGNNSAALAQLKANADDILSRTTRAIQAAEAMQQAARNLSLQSSTAVPNGLTVGGLQVATGAHSGWQGANLPVQSVANGQVTVTIQQTASQALLNWQTFNLGKNTTAYFNQSAGGSAAHTWVALNQIWDLSPSQILGSIKAQGQVYLINQNGIVFGGSSQINVGSLFAAATATPASQLFVNGLYQTYAGGPGSIVVQSGAQIATNAPQTTTSGGGFVILLGNSVTNAGSITTPNGQTLIAAGKTLLLSQGYSVGASSTTQNTTSTTVGTVAEVTKGGEVTNSGLIESTTGDITLVGGQVTQAGIAVATTSVAKRGTIHLLTDASVQTTSVTLAPGSVTLITSDPNSGLALDPQRANAYSEETAYAGLATVLNDEVGLPDQIGLSRIEITTGGTVNFAANSLTSATAGQIEVSAGKKVFVDSAAELDVSGLVGVNLPMSANNLAVNIQGYEVRDDPLNRDTKTLFNSTVYVNINQLVEVPASSAYSQNRFYTSGGVFEVSGELNNVQHSIDEWSTVGGSIVLSAPQVVAKSGSVFDIAGGTINYQSGYLKESWLIGTDGRFYNANTAPASLVYAGVWNGFQVNHPRWNVVETYQDVLVLPAQIYQGGYTVGRDAGTLTIDAPTALFAGTIQAGTYAGSQQNTSRPSTVGDPFLLPQNVVPLNGSLLVEPYPTYTLSNGTWVINQVNPNTNNVVFSNDAVSTPDSPTATTVVRNTDLFSAQQIDAALLGGLTVNIEAPPVSTTPGASEASSGKGHLTIEAPLTFAPGALIALTAAEINLEAGIVSPGGDVSITSDAYPVVGGSALPTPVTGIGINLAPGAVIDTRGLWTNAELDPYDIGGEAYINGGSVSLVSDRGLILGTGSLIDASSGGEISPAAKISGGAGGNISVEGDLATTAQDQVINSPVVLDGRLRSYGVTHGGALTLQGHSFLIANQPIGLKKNQIWIAPGFFDQGFSSYTLLGLTGVTVAPGTQITVTEPVYQVPLVSPNVALNVPTGANVSEVFGSPALMPVYLPNPATDTFTQRPGASLTLEAGVNYVSRTTASGKGVSGVTVGGITMGTGAAITVDPGQSVALAGNGQITVDGTITAPGGSILIGNTRSLGGGEDTYNVGALSIWIGSNSRLDVSGQAITALDTLGRVFGFVTGAGSIFLGGFGTPQTATLGGDYGEAAYLALAPNLPVTASEEAPTDAFVIVRPGAQLDAQGNAAWVNTNLLPAGGSFLTNALPPLTNSSLIPIASNGGSITFDSFTSIFLDGSMNARGGGGGASGGSLTVALFAPHYDTGLWTSGVPPGDMVDPASVNPIYGSDPARTNYLVPDRMRHLRIITIGSNPQSSGLGANLQPGELDPKLIAGRAYLSTQTLASAGFANLTLVGGDGVVFRGDVTLKMPESINLSAAILGDTRVTGQVRILAPYVLLNAIGGGNSLAGNLGSGTLLGTVYGPASLGPKDSSSFYSASLTVDANLIDLESTQYILGAQVGGNTPTPQVSILQFGASVSYTVANGSTAQVNYATFPQITLVSQGDIRFLTGSTGGGTLSAPGNLALVAAQIYPTTGANWIIEAGQDPVPNQNYYAQGTSITIARVNAETPSVPDSVFGELVFQAATINQGGVIRAPFGDLTFQEESILEPNGQTVSSNSGLNFLPGSITSVSANGLTMQYGGTTNGSVYTVNGNSITLYDPLTGYPSGVSPNFESSASVFQLGIHINTTGGLLTVDKGALLDLSGGGNLTGAGFISGEGGSVDVLSTPLVNANPILNSFSSAADSVYAIVPGFQGYAPVAGGTSTPYTGGIPSVGQQITLPSGIPGLAAGTYTLLPANYALLPGAFRVELGKNSSFTQVPVVSVGNGSYLVQSYSAVANTGFYGTAPIETIVTPGTKVRDYSDYDEENYAGFIVSQAQLYNRPAAMIPADASLLTLTFGIPNAPALAMQFQGTTDFTPANGGISGSLYINGFGGTTNLEILGPGSAPTSGWTGVSVGAADIDAIGAPNVFIGGFLDPVSGFILGFFGGTGSIVLRTGAVLTGAQVDLLSQNSITIEAGAGIDTLGRGAPNVDSSQGYLFTNSVPNGNSPPSVSSVVVVSNGYLDISPGTGASTENIVVASGASLYSEGSIGFAAPGSVVLGTGVNFGARYLDFSLQSVNIGSQSALNAQTQGTLPAGLTLTQDLLSDLLRGNPAIGAPPLQMLTLSASQSINFYGSVDLSTINPVTGKSSLQELVLDTPAVYGAGASGDTATITTGTLVWNGLGQVLTHSAGSGSVSVIGDTPPGPVIANGPGTGSGTLNIVANEIIFGYSPTDQPQNNTSLSRLVLGFSTVNLTATQEITANNKGTLSVYQTQTGATYSGGSLNLITPLLTGAPGSIMNYKVGGALTLSSPAAISPSTTMPDSLGAEINLSANSISDSTSIMAATGKVTLTANGNIDLLSGATINVAGQVIPMFDQNVATWGGDVALESTQGSVIQAAGSIINVSAIGNNAGSLNITATSGQVQIAGILLGSTTGNFNGGSFDVGAQTIGDFVALNALLDAGGFYYSRIFDIKQGDLTIAAGTTIRAHDVEISIDNGSLTVAGTIDASGVAPGIIRLSAGGNLELTATSVLDVHNTVLQVDSYGQPIDAENRGTIELTVADGTDTSTANLNNGQGSLLLDAGATIDMASPDGVARGDLELNAPRTGETSGDIRISAAGPLNITGAQTIALNAFWTYAPTDPNGTIVQSPGSEVPTGAIILDQVNTASVAFITAAETDTALQSRLAGLTAYGANFHLRPGVEIVSATPNGNLTIVGDIDLSRYRYGPNADVDPTSPNYGAGEPGVLTIRAGGNLNIYGSITDGFKQPPPVLGTQAGSGDDNGWVLYSGPTTQDIVVPIQVILGSGTTYSSESIALNYTLTSVSATVAIAYITEATVTGTNAGKTVTITAGHIVPPGTILASIPAGTNLSAFSTISLQSDQTVPAGGLIPMGTNISFDPTLVTGNYIPLRSSAGVSGSAASGPGNQGATWAIASMLSPGDLSWSIRLVAGADTSAADTRIVLPASQLASMATPNNPDPGSLTLSDLHYMDPTNSLVSLNENFSVLRTGTGYLDLIAGGSFSEESVYGIYTAGTQSSGVTASFNLGRDGLASDGTITGTPLYNQVADTISNGGTYQANYPQDGGNLFLAAQGDVTGFTTLSSNLQASAMVGYWLWRQGGAGISQSTAWWINFGTYAYDIGTGGPVLIGFTGIGTLGGGNVTIDAGRNAGVTIPSFSESGNQSGSLIVAVGATGRVQNGVLVQTGGGNVTINVGEALNPAFFAPFTTSNVLSGGEFVDVRGDVTIKAGSVGGLYLSYGNSAADDPRAISPFEAGLLSSSFSAAGLLPLYGGPILIPGDSSITIQSRGDLVVSAAGDPGRVPDSNATSATTSIDWNLDPSVNGEGYTWFSLWTQSTSIHLYSAGGNLSPILTGELGQDDSPEPAYPNTAIYPPSLTAIAISGSAYLPSSALGSAIVLELAPAPNGQFELLAGKSIYGNATYTQGSDTVPLQIDISGADPSQLPNPFNPAWYLYPVATNSQSVGVGGPSLFGTYATTGNTSPNGTANQPSQAANGQAYQGPGALFAFEADSASGVLHANDSSPALIYAVAGDVVDLGFGQIFNAFSFQSSNPGYLPWYIMAKATWIRAGRDIVNFGQSASAASAISTDQPNYILNNSKTDVSVISAGRDILFANVDIYGPGNLEVSAGRNITQAGQENGAVVEGILDSKGLLGNARAQNPNGGAGIITLVGVGPDGPDWSAFENLYLNPANVANSSELLIDQPGKVVQTYQGDLYTWLQQNYLYTGSEADELSYFESLPVPVQSVFLLQKVYFAELNQSGVEYNTPTSPFYQSYVRGEEAIRTLFPTVGPNGQPISYNGSLSMYSQANPGFASGGADGPPVYDSSILTEFGGGITVVDPGGQVLVGAQGVIPGSTAGILTEGSGNINIYSEGSVLLGLARILTTFGGNIVIWSQNGDINAGKGSKGTVIFAPVGVSYDEFANLTLSPTVPSTGAGIGTLQPIPDVPPGDVNLVAPNGVIDLGEAGLRASGNANLAARVIINAANISVAGKVTGIPTIVAPNTAAVTAANNVAGASNNVANEVAKQQATTSQQPVDSSVIIVEVLGYGGGDEANPSPSPVP